MVRVDCIPQEAGRAGLFWGTHKCTPIFFPSAQQLEPGPQVHRPLALSEALLVACVHLPSQAVGFWRFPWFVLSGAGGQDAQGVQCGLVIGCPSLTLGLDGGSGLLGGGVPLVWAPVWVSSGRALGMGPGVGQVPFLVGASA